MLKSKPGPSARETAPSKLVESAYRHHLSNIGTAALHARTSQRLSDAISKAVMRTLRRMRAFQSSPTRALRVLR